jgi:ATP-dependent Clp protease protease subunit
MNELLINFERAGVTAGASNKTISKYLNLIQDFSYKTKTPIIHNMTPSVIEEAPNGNLISYDVYTRLMKDRVMFIGHPIMTEVTNIAIAQILFLEMTDKKKDIVMYLNSPGGDVNAGLSLINVMDYVEPDVNTVVVGMAASMGAVILSCGTKGKRYGLLDSRVMIHQPSGGMQGKSDDMTVQYEQMLLVKKRLYEILAEKSGQTYDEILSKSKLDYWMSSEEAKKEGFIDEVLVKRK